MSKVPAGIHFIKEDGSAKLSITPKALGWLAATFGLVSALIGGAAGYGLGYGYGTLKAVECVTAVTAQAVQKYDVAILKSGISACVRATGFPALNDYQIK